MMRKRNCPLPGLVDRSPLKVDMTKKKGLGPRTGENLKQHFLQGNDKFEEDKIKQHKVMKDGPKNSVHGVDLSKDPHWQPHQFKK